MARKHTKATVQFLAMPVEFNVKEDHPTRPGCMLQLSMFMEEYNFRLVVNCRLNLGGRGVTLFQRIKVLCLSSIFGGIVMCTMYNIAEHVLISGS